MQMKRRNVPGSWPQNRASNYYEPTDRNLAENTHQQSWHPHLQSRQSVWHAQHGRTVHLPRWKEKHHQVVQVMNTRTTLEPCISGTRKISFNHSRKEVWKCNVWTWCREIRAAKSCSPARSSNYINWTTRIVTVIYLKWKNPLLETANNETWPVTAVIRALHCCCLDKHLALGIHKMKDANQRKRNYSYIRTELLKETVVLINSIIFFKNSSSEMLILLNCLRTSNCE
jgi:hypothetical protein